MNDFIIRVRADAPHRLSVFEALAVAARTHTHTRCTMYATLQWPAYRFHRFLCVCVYALKVAGERKLIIIAV